jgi:hypothetical protein
MDCSRDFLVFYDWTMESSLRNSYLNCRNSHILGLAIPVMHSPHSSMPARTRVALYPSIWSIVPQAQVLKTRPLKPTRRLHRRAARMGMTYWLPLSHANDRVTVKSASDLRTDRSADQPLRYSSPPFVPSLPHYISIIVRPLNLQRKMTPRTNRRRHGSALTATHHTPFLPTLFPFF